MPDCFVTVAVMVASTHNNDIMNFKNPGKRLRRYELENTKNRKQNNINNVLRLIVFTRNRTKSLCLYFSDIWEFK
jgi:hypothetical protein